METGKERGDYGEGDLEVCVCVGRGVDGWV